MRYIKDLSSETISILKRLHKQSKHSRVRQRAHCILLSYERYQIKEIMAILDISRSTLHRLFDAWESEKLVGLYDKSGAGRKPKLTSDEQEQVVKWTKAFPKNLLKVCAFFPGDLCNQNEMTKCQKLITKACNMVYTNPNFNFSPDSYFLLYNGRYSQGVCACINSSLVPPSKKIYDDPTAMCFDQNCTLPIPNTTNPIITMNDLLGLNDTYCRTQCNTLKSVLEGEASNIQNLNVSRYKRLCGQSINVTFNTSFFIC